MHVSLVDFYQLGFLFYFITSHNKYKINTITSEGQDVAASSVDSRGRSAASEGVLSCAHARAAARAAGGAPPCTRCCWEISVKLLYQIIHSLSLHSCNHHYRRD